jgi:hypothetical protein
MPSWLAHKLAPRTGNPLRRSHYATRNDRRAPVKIALTRFEWLCSPRVVYNLSGAFNYLHVGWWLHSAASVGLRARENGARGR